MADLARLRALAARHGVAAEYEDVWGKRREASAASLQALLGALGVTADERPETPAALPAAVVVVDVDAPWTIDLPGADADGLEWRIREESGAVHAGAAEAGDAGARLRLDLHLPLGYHELTLARRGAPPATAALVVAPERCYRPPALEGGGRVWGPALQLYALRSERNWGIGDFTDLAAAADLFGTRGADIVGVNPLHALFPHDPERASPYSPSSRVFLDVLYLDVEAIDDFRECEDALALARSAEFQSRLAALRAAPLVDYAGVATAKMAVLELIYRRFRAAHLDGRSPRASAFRAFAAERGPSLARHALFEALQERFHRDDPRVWGWPMWPADYRDPTSLAVARFAAENVERVEFYAYLQWQAGLQLARAADAMAGRGLAVGLYADLAVSIDRGGAEAWANQSLYAVEASIGAPPDLYNLNGQNWGLPPLHPERLREARYAPFVEMLRANMRHAGALRIDHAMGLMRLFWVPPGGTPADGAYVHYPLDDLLGIVALESHRNRCLVIGEDLGTVPAELRAALERRGVLSYRLLWFERDAEGGFKRPADYPVEALVAATTHDLPTVAGFWEGRDHQLRQELGLFPSEAARQSELVGRVQDRVRLLLALEREALLPPRATADPSSLPEATPELAAAVQALLARAPSRVLMVQLEDVLGVRDAINVPGTTIEQPNWRRKLPVALERLPDDPRFAAVVRTLAELRPRAAEDAARRAGATTRIPRATYRVQLHREFTFADAERIVPYLARLGASHLYCSPVLRARPGSTHGYDIVDHAQISPELGGRAGLDALVTALKAHGMGLVLDIVPNHMGVLGGDNGWWLDVLENGPASAYAGFFDIDWHPLDDALENRVLVPVLGDHYGHVLERGELALAFDAARGELLVHYYDHRFPVDPRQYPQVLAAAPSPSLDAAVAAELASLAAAFGHLPPRDATDAEAIAERTRDKAIHKRRLARLVAAEPAAAAAVERAVKLVNGTPGDAGSFARLDALLEAQAYRLAFWRVASDEINYRRFFDVNDLAALRMENEAVFNATHATVLELAATGHVDGLRVDHPDGLYDPALYFRRLQERYAQLAKVPLGPREGEHPPRPLWVVAEKILAAHERLPEDWALHGTTGYRFGAVLNGLFVDGDARGKLERIWRTFTGSNLDFEEAAYRGKRAIMRAALASEVTVLAAELLRLARADRRTRDYTSNTLRQALTEVIACFPVYRTYIGPDRSAPVSRADRRHIDWAIAHARRRSRTADTSIFDFVHKALLAEAPRGADPALAARYRAFAMKMQQVTAPVTAKGVEDTAFYAYTPLASLNEVGAGPERFGITVSGFHGAAASRAARWPHTMLATSTHDSKRAEDVRLRIDVLSEMPAAWRLLLRRWSRLNRSKKRTVEGAAAPSRADEHLLYQTLLGTFPVAGPETADLGAYRERIERYVTKAVREAKVHSSWVSVNAAYEGAAKGFIAGVLSGDDGNLFLADLREWAARVGWFGALNTLSATTLKLASPGVPDIYQGTELMALALVDPDNRRPVDYEARAALLDALVEPPRAAGATRAAQARALLETPHDDRAKLWIVARALGLRRDDPALFERGDYAPLAVRGAKADHVVAFARRHENRVLVAVAGRLYLRMLGEPGRWPLGEAWEDAEIDLAPIGGEAPLTNALTGEVVVARGGRVRLAEVLGSFPVALLTAER